MKSRTRARSVALQALYEIDMTGHPAALVVQQRVDEAGLDPTQAEFAAHIVAEVWPLVEALDALIAVHAPEWPLDQVAVIDRNILRIALWEFAVDSDTPIKVAINEAVELAKMYGSDNSGRFINGVLGSLSNRTEEIHQSFARLKNDLPGAAGQA